MTEKQLSAVVYKTTVLYLRQRKSLIIQILATVGLLLAAGFIRVQTGTGSQDMDYGGQSSEYSLYPDVIYGCYNLPSNYTCSPEIWFAFTNPPEGDSAGTLDNSTSSLFLSKIDQNTYQFYNYCSEETTYKEVPFFVEFNSTDDLNNYLIDSQTTDVYCGSSGDATPNFGVEFSTINYEEMELSYSLISQSPFEEITYQYFFSDAATVYATSQLSSAFASYVLNTTVTILPSAIGYSVNQTYYDYSAQWLSGFVLVPISVSLTMPLFVYALVMEKSTKVLELSKLMRLKMRYYWAAHILVDMGMYLIPFSLVVLFGVLFQMAFMSSCWSVSVPLFVLWGFSQVTFSFFFAAFFYRERVATVVTYIFVFLSLIIGIVLNLFAFTSSEHAPFWYMWLPPWAFVRGFFLLQDSFIDPYTPRPSLWSLGFPNELWNVFAWLIFETIIFFALALLLEEVLPKEWGKSRKPFFFITDFIKKKKAGSKNSEENVQLLSPNQQNYSEEDDNIKKERINANSEDEKFLLRCRHVTKNYSGEKLALDDLFLAIESGECFGLLGPNGAGKTTLISILSGIIEATQGYCIIDGKSTLDDDPTIRDAIGICPQFDILWDDLSVREHLHYYYLLKGVNEGEKAHVLINQLIDNVGLADHMNKLASELSGGMRRKLSIAISLVGSPKLLLLDEPTTGLDPEARRDIWNIITKARAGRSTIITTHNMEEADVLSTRIGIVNRGKFSCVGNQQYLKNRFGEGYSLTVTCLDGYEERVIEFVQSHYPHCTVESNYHQTITFLIPLKELSIPALFSLMRNEKENQGIKEWGINQSSLEEVFLKLVRDNEEAGEESNINMDLDDDE